MISIPEQWADRAMLESGRLVYVLFCCQQAVEKMLKAVIAKRTNEMPPRLHNLIRLAEYTRLEIGKDRLSFLGQLSSYYTQTRYPEDTESLAQRVSEAIAQETFNKTEETIEWLLSVK